MASTGTYLEYILEQFSALEEITYRPMMGEYILYHRGKVFGGIYDDRLLVKPVPSVLRMMPGAPWELPYPGAKEMLLVEQTDAPEFLKDLISSVYPELPEPKKKKRK